MEAELKRFIISTVLAVALAIGFTASASAQIKLVIGADKSDKLKYSIGLAIPIGGPLWSITSFDMNLTEGEKKVEPMIAALFDVQKLPLPLLNKLPIKAGPIFGPEFEWTDEGTFTDKAQAYVKAAIGGAISIPFDSARGSGLVAYYKAAVSLDDAVTAPLGPSFGFRFFTPFSAIADLL